MYKGRCVFWSPIILFFVGVQKKSFRVLFVSGLVVSGGLALWFDDFDDDALFCRWGCSHARAIEGHTRVFRRRRATTRRTTTNTLVVKEEEESSKRYQHAKAMSSTTKEEEEDVLFDRLKEKLAEIDCLSSLQGFAGWDELTMMPSGRTRGETAFESVRRASRGYSSESPSTKN